jgi:hypothetical protein
MANIRFLDQVSVNSFAGGGDSTINGTPLPTVILAGQTFTIAANTSTSTYNLTVFGTLRVEKGAQVEAPDGSIIYTNGQLYIDNMLDNQGTIINDGFIVVGT